MFEFSNPKEGANAVSPNVSVPSRDPILGSAKALLLSMTGHGESHIQQDEVSVGLEVRTLNSRYFKLTVRAGEGYTILEPRIEPIVRRYVRRGTVQVTVKVVERASAEDYRLNVDILASYRQQLEELFDQLHVPDAVHLDSLLMLPGVVDPGEVDSRRTEQAWPLIQQALEQALNNLAQMRAEEGRTMQKDLDHQRETVLAELAQIEVQAPRVVEAYRDRLADRLQKLLAEHDAKFDSADIIREVGMFAERSDISEELVRLRSHIDQFQSIVALPESSGRKLDFLTQEMFRETNTIGAKANDAQIARHVVEIKAAIERMREMIQNIE